VPDFPGLIPTASRNKDNVMGDTSTALAAMAARRPSKERIIETLREKAGIVAAAARTLGVHRSTLYNWMEEDKSGDIAAATKDIREEVTDLAEGKLFENIEKGRSEDIRFYLRCFGGPRGYKEVTRIEGRDGGPIEMEHTFDPRPESLRNANLENLSWEDLQDYRRLRQKMNVPLVEGPATEVKAEPAPAK
jgi:transposase-like protein